MLIKHTGKEVVMSNLRKMTLIGTLIAVLLIAGLVVPVSIMRAAADEKTPPTFTVKGVVTNAETGKPIVGAKVGDLSYEDGKQFGVTF